MKKSSESIMFFVLGFLIGVVGYFTASVLLTTQAQVNSSVIAPASAIAAASIAVAAPAIALYSAYNSRRQFGLSALTKVHETIGSETARAHRAKIYDAYRKYKSTHDIREYDVCKVSVSQVRADMNMVGSMYKHGLLPREAFLDIYYGLVLNCYRIIEPATEVEANTRNEKRYMSQFKDLYTEASNFMKEKNFPTPEIY